MGREKEKQQIGKKKGNKKKKKKEKEWGKIGERMKAVEKGRKQLEEDKKKGE